MTASLTIEVDPGNRATVYAVLCALRDCHTRNVLGWTVSNTMDTELCLKAVQEALSLAGTLPPR
jgi:transposase InsO family protein